MEIIHRSAVSGPVGIKLLALYPTRDKGLESVFFDRQYFWVDEPAHCLAAWGSGEGALVVIKFEVAIHNVLQLVEHCQFNCRLAKGYLGKKMTTFSWLGKRSPIIWSFGRKA